MFQRNGPSAGAEEAERPDLEKQARFEDLPVGTIQPALIAEHQHRQVPLQVICRARCQNGA